MEDLLMALGRIPMIHATLAHYPIRRSMVRLLFFFFNRPTAPYQPIQVNQQ